MIEPSTLFPKYVLVQKEFKEDHAQLRIVVVTKDEVNEKKNYYSNKAKSSFNKDEIFNNFRQNCHQVYISPRKCAAFKIQQSCLVIFSEGVQKLQDFYGIACDLLLSAYKFSRKSTKEPEIQILIKNEQTIMKPILQLVNAKIHSRQLVNGRGDIEGSPSFIVNEILRMKNQYNCQVTIYKGEELLKEGFRLLHAVGRASSREPVFANITYTGNKDSDKYVAFVGKGVCFDAGGLDIKNVAAMKTMFLDKQGACSVLSAFEQVVKEKLPVNLTCSVGLVQNYIGPNSYRPNDIIKSRKGLTVKIDDTDAEGRLVLADAMHWTQQNFKTQVLIQLSTLTYSNILALGQKYAGLFSNSTQVSEQLFKLGKNVHEHVWRMPVDIQHHQALQIQEADILSDDSSQWAPGGSIAAAFLQKFVEKNVKWVHLDIGGVSFMSELGTGWGCMLLVQYMRLKANKTTKS